MAITFVDSAESSSVSPGSDLTVVLPSMNEGDVVYLFVMCGATGTLGMNTGESEWLASEPTGALKGRL